MRMRLRNVDLQALINAGKGDAPLFHLRFRCSYCEHRGCEDPWWCRGSVRPRAEVTVELIIGIRDSSGVAGDSSASQRRIVLIV
jgi:hypothetical protein